MGIETKASNSLCLLYNILTKILTILAFMVNYNLMKTYGDDLFERLQTFGCRMQALSLSM